MKVRQPSNALALAVGALALAVATTGTAVAATGQLVHITDPVNAASKARVSKGQLKVDPAPTRPAHGTAWISVNRYNVVIPHTTSTVALTDLTWAVWPNGQPHSVWLYQAGVPAGSDCSDIDDWTQSRYLGMRMLQPAATLVEGRTTPLVLAPFSAGAPWCLVISGVGLDTMAMTWSGHVLAGTLPTTGPASSAPRLSEGSPVPSGPPSLTVTPTG